MEVSLPLQSPNILPLNLHRQKKTLQIPNSVCPSIKALHRSNLPALLHSILNLTDQISDGIVKLSKIY
jgi:hypothetical protein